MKFYKWLERYDGPRWVALGKLEGAVGDLRTEVLNDRDWPKDATTRKACEDAIYRAAPVGDVRGAMRALRVAWQLYRLEHPNIKKLVAKAKARAKTHRRAMRAAREVIGRQPIAPRLRFEIMKRDGWRCCLCGAGVPNGATLEIDHKVAVARGGSNDVSNLWTLCFPCNRGKHVQAV